MLQANQHLPIEPPISAQADESSQSSPQENNPKLSQSGKQIIERFVIRRKDEEKYVHILEGNYVLLPGRRDGLLVFDKRFLAKNFKKQFEDRDSLEVVIDE